MAEKTVPQTTEHSAAATQERPTPSTREEQRYHLPPVDIYETKDGLTVVADLPGVEKDGIDVRVNNGVLSIHGKVKHEVQGDGFYNEFVLLDYFRQFELNDEVDQEKISAELRHGVLTLKLPKAEKAKPKQITVKVA